MPSSPSRSTLFPYTTLFRSHQELEQAELRGGKVEQGPIEARLATAAVQLHRSEEHTSELQSLRHLVCRLHHRDLHSSPTRRSSDLIKNSSRRNSVAVRLSRVPLRRAWQLPRSSCTDRKSTRLNSSHLGISYAVFTIEIYTLPLHDALPISSRTRAGGTPWR